ncbi:MAG: hypothetical protein PHI71_10010 [Acidiphilium sp.]|nr:hypothetical protein [Acidiphilium sp.]
MLVTTGTPPTGPAGTPKVDSGDAPPAHAAFIRARSAELSAIAPHGPGDPEPNDTIDIGEVTEYGTPVCEVVKIVPVTSVSLPSAYSSILRKPALALIALIDIAMSAAGGNTIGTAVGVGVVAALASAHAAPPIAPPIVQNICCRLAPVETTGTITTAAIKLSSIAYSIDVTPFLSINLILPSMPAGLDGLLLITAFL